MPSFRKKIHFYYVQVTCRKYQNLELFKFLSLIGGTVFFLPWLLLPKGKYLNNCDLTNFLSFLIKKNDMYCTSQTSKLTMP